MALNHLAATAKRLPDAHLVVNRDTYRALAVEAHVCADEMAATPGVTAEATTLRRQDAEMFAATADVFSQEILDRAAGLSEYGDALRPGDRQSLAA